MTNYDILLAHFTDTKTVQYNKEKSMLELGIIEDLIKPQFINFTEHSEIVDSYKLSDCIKEFQTILNNKQLYQSHFELDIDQYSCDKGTIVYTFRNNYMMDESEIIKLATKLATKFNDILNKGFNKDGCKTAETFINDYIQKHNIKR